MLTERVLLTGRDFSLMYSWEFCRRFSYKLAVHLVHQPRRLLDCKICSVSFLRSLSTIRFDNFGSEWVEQMKTHFLDSYASLGRHRGIFQEASMQIRLLISRGRGLPSLLRLRRRRE